ncbi:hypothetical protein GWR56_13715 [Mucilaginibacter sp. 14171R-50]|uniref:putative sensor domain DACNV-containing protein n=1 Tax=Mucilaginibacter sp. 14171R-50 TaxID=2703789 RepID=UPI00138D0F76|nr:hypothetical protein [Mucilaginibacter sp. 14171R-50]QHS56546.1 hypothetical protein GWR56_13715 [Mucilaginibacter sp. 14171R-50]
MSEVKTTIDLATFVYQKLQASKFKGKKPPETVLSSLFSILFYASLATEESDFIKVTVTLLTKEFKATASRQGSYDESQLFPFDEPIPFTEKNLIKLSKAADPWSSSLAVDYDDHDQLFIYGMIDQALHFQSFLNFEREEKPHTTGIIQTIIEDVGVLNVIFEFEPLATLNKSQLTRRYIDVFKQGPVADFMKKNTAELKKHVDRFIRSEKYAEFTLADWEELIEKLYVQSISRILLKIRNYRHGGAILITNDFIKGLAPKYSLNYDRLEIAKSNLLKTSILYDSVTGDLDVAESEAKKAVSMDDYLDYAESMDALQEAESELKGAVRFISSLSCVDGLVVLSYRLHVKSFGTVITEKELPESVQVSSTAVARANLKPMDPKHFGTRHRSLFAYCYANPGSLGFVISQDGEIRAVMKVGEELVMWEHIKVHQFLKSKKILPLSPAKS